MPTRKIATETALTVVKHLINGRDDQFIATATGLTETQVQDIKIGHGYPDRDKMEHALAMLERRTGETTTRTGPSPSRPPVSSRLARGGQVTNSAPRAVDPKPITSSVRQAKPSANELIVAASRSPKARTRSLGAKIAGLLGDLSDRLAQEEQEEARQAAEEAENAKRLKRIAQLEAELRSLRGKVRRTKTAPTLGAPAPKVRQWAKESGIECPAFGKVPARVRDAYDAAHAAA
ncbi:Lsr2 family DNA-binding protein [Luteipulveratus halotolerans]|uniref:Lsr2 DNA-binding domain-containing protein n=1 Tax=Luteipulveratus halotolerans TaxID=1631356 RepID=A0A0L6CE33_9MICO|nr:Lsr2 family protein [Luteipulveratus halotolerans]KNX35860.1 hypothetical protein VV01_21520 [Luteipulveratus halotolerans]